jgi:uroporphyrinogen-III synthase
MLIPSHNLPLFRQRVLITAPRAYGARLSEKVINQGGLPLLMPTIETCFLDDYNLLDIALNNIAQYQWIAFTSRHGIEAFFQRLNTLKFPRDFLKNCQLCAIGKDAEKLLEFTDAVIIPRESSPQGIVDELAKIPHIQNQSILLPVPLVVGIPEPDIVPNFVMALQKLSLNVTRVPVYLTRALERGIYELELSLLRLGKIDILAFSSTAEIESFLRMVDSPVDYEKCAIACFGPYTAANAEKLGLNVDICSENFSSFDGFVDAMIKWLN